MTKTVFQLMGAFLWLAAVTLLVGIAAVGHFSMRAPPLTLRLAARVIVGFTLFVCVGCGLICLRKWAALAFCIGTLYCALWAFRDALYSAPWSLDGIGYWYSILLVGPSILTLRHWHNLTWRRMPSAAPPPVK